jgi:hypothetical protein
MIENDAMQSYRRANFAFQFRLADEIRKLA